MDVPGRARRRHDRQRMIAKAIRIFRSYDRQYLARCRRHDAEKLADNLAFCSRWCCRNPRRVFKGLDRLPFQEIRAMNRLEDGS
jgi:hypothetical protein